MFYRVIRAGYDRSKMDPGYKGKFVIQKHDADEAGKHWDIRIEFPVESIDHSLGEYEDKRNPETNEPWGQFYDKPGTVYRSFVTKKREIPTKGDKIYLIETEDHPISYGKFEGTIPKGEYGSGEVEVYDKGDYKLLERDGDKKYVFDFKGEKLDGTYALVKFKEGYLWVKADVDNDKTASVIDYTRPTLSPQIWDLEKDPPVIRDRVRKFILTSIMDSLVEYGFETPWKWIKGIKVVGSITTYNYDERSDVDTVINYDIEKLKSISPEFKDYRQEDIRALFNEALKSHEGNNIPGTTHPAGFTFIEKETLDSDSSYDLLKGKWIKGPHKTPTSFDPDIAFKAQRSQAARIAVIIDYVVGEIVRISEDLEAMNQFSRHYPHHRINVKRIMAMTRLRRWCNELDSIHYKIRDIWNRRFHLDNDDLVYPAYEFSTNWEAGVVIFKYLQKWGYHRPVAMLYDRMKGHPMLEVIDQIIPDD